LKRRIVNRRSLANATGYATKPTVAILLYNSTNGRREILAQGGVARAFFLTCCRHHWEENYCYCI